MCALNTERLHWQLATQPRELTRYVHAQCCTRFGVLPLTIPLRSENTIRAAISGRYIFSFHNSQHIKKRLTFRNHQLTVPVP